MNDIILHHYPQSPFSEKIRVVLGMKDLDWRSVIIPRLPPKPDLIPLTGGYRLTPVMQIGADVFCDTLCISRELERQKPKPTLFPGGAGGMAWGVGRWIDGPLFTAAIALVFGAGADEMSDEFKADRGPLYFGRGYDVDAIKEALPATLAELRAQIAWMDERLTSRDFMLGAEPGLPDALCYYVIWFIRGRYGSGPEFLSQFPRLTLWEERVKAIGHGRPVEMEASDALAIAKAATPRTAAPTDGDGTAGRTPGGKDLSEPMDLKPGDEVGITPSGVSGCPTVVGRIVGLNIQEIAIARTDDRVGDVVVHFPRVNYRIAKT